ncbi:unnamed protein product [Porites evermanni]|uniref:Uncharacterized protein n=1 Tax=Porites evermanni TaxID=104178 RepID=A0ABN8RC97_9CNID|nr:unnamed protein product [Porites evermanni]
MEISEGVIRRGRMDLHNSSVDTKPEFNNQINTWIQDDKTGKERAETDSHITAECKKLAQNQYKNWRHDKVAQVLHWNLSKKFNLQCSETWPACPFDTRVAEKQKEKIQHASGLKSGSAIWNCRSVISVTPIVIEALGTVSKHLRVWISKLGTPGIIDCSRKLVCCWEQLRS